MADTVKESPLSTVTVEALVAMKIVKHCSSTFPTVATGSIVGMDQNNVLEVTNSFPLPTVEIPNPENTPPAAAAITRRKAHVAYQNEMIKHLKEVNVDANNVGWYTSATMGNFVNAGFIEYQFQCQKDNDKAVALVHDVSRSSQGSLSLRAFRLMPAFMTAYKDGTFSTESLQKSKLSFKDILQEYTVTVHNSHLLTSFLHQLPEIPQSDTFELPTSLSELRDDDPSRQPLHPSVDNLDLSIDPFLEKTCDLLLDSIDAHYSDVKSHDHYQRLLGREQAKISQWQSKRKAENAQRALAKQPPLPEDEWQRLFKLPQEPSRLEGMLHAKQVEQYSKQVDGFTANISAKMFAVRENLVPKHS